MARTSKRGAMPDGGQERKGWPTGPADWQARAVIAADRAAGLLEPLGLPRADFFPVLKAFAIAFVAGVAFTLVHLPLPWLLGPLTVALVLTLGGHPPAQPKFLVQPVRALLGVAVGGSFTPALVEKLGGMTGSILLMIPYMVIATLLGIMMLMRFARFDRPTAFFASAPGGLADMVMMAEEAGANLRHVTLVQAARLVAIVFLVPFWLQFGEGLPLGGAVPKTTHLGELLVVDALLIVAIAWIGWRVGERLGLLGASMIGPMLLSGLAHGFGFTTVKVPVELLVFTQLTLGIVIGANFRGVSMRECFTVLSWGFVFAVALVAGAAVFAMLVAKVTGLDATTLLLCYAPGGQNEMAILGLILGLDVAVIALHHFVRVFMVIIGAQVVFRSHTSWKKPLETEAPPSHR